MIRREHAIVGSDVVLHARPDILALQAAIEQVFKYQTDDGALVREARRQHRANLIVVVDLFSLRLVLSADSHARPPNPLADAGVVRDRLDDGTIELRVLLPVPLENLEPSQDQLAVRLSSSDRFSVTNLADRRAVLQRPLHRLDYFGPHRWSALIACLAAGDTTFPSMRAVDFYVVANHQMETTPAMGGRSKSIALAVVRGLPVRFEQRRPHRERSKRPPLTKRDQHPRCLVDG